MAVGLHFQPWVTWQRVLRVKRCSVRLPLALGIRRGLMSSRAHYIFFLLPLRPDPYLFATLLHPPREEANLIVSFFSMESGNSF